jgi:DNA-binding NtrC family response regulator
MEPSRRKLLVVDDDRLVRLNLALTLGREGYSVDVASGVGEAVALIDRERYVVVVTDIGLEDGTGFEVLRTAKQAAPSTKVILLTGSQEVIESADLVVDGAEALLLKPFALAELTDAVRRATGHASEAERGAPQTEDGETSPGPETNV